MGSKFETNRSTELGAYFSELLLLRYKWVMSDGLGSGMKNSAAVRSGTPISHKVGPFLGGSNTILPRSISLPAYHPYKLHEIITDEKSSKRI